MIGLNLDLSPVARLIQAIGAASATEWLLQARVVAEPPVMARVKRLGERGIELEVTVWMADPVVGEGELRSDILKDVVKSFRAEGITLPYARREVVMIATPEIANFPSTSIR